MDARTYREETRYDGYGRAWKTRDASGGWLKQQFDALARGQLAFFVLTVDAFLATAEAGQFTLFFQLANDVVHKNSLRKSANLEMSVGNQWFR